MTKKSLYVLLPVKRAKVGMKVKDSEGRNCVISAISPHPYQGHPYDGEDLVVHIKFPRGDVMPAYARTLSYIPEPPCWPPKEASSPRYPHLNTEVLPS
jgi:hypothetical protein